MEESRFSWFKEKFVEAAIGVFITGLLFLGGFGAVEAFLADYRRDKLKDELIKTMTDLNNETVKREGVMLEKMATLERLLGEQKKRVSFPMVVPAPEPASETLNPAQVRLNYQDKHSKTYDQFKINGAAQNKE